MKNKIVQLYIDINWNIKSNYIEGDDRCYEEREREYDEENKQ